MDPAMYIFVNKSLGMSPGKLGAQVAHAAVEAYRLSCQPHPNDRRTQPAMVESDLVKQWYLGGHYKKLVMQARDALHLYTIERYLRERGFDTVLIIDEGMTEIEPHIATALGVAVVDKDDPHTAASFGRFRIYKEDRAPAPKKKWWQNYFRLGK